MGLRGKIADVGITARKAPSAFGRWWNSLLSISFDGGYYFTANTWGESGERRVSHTAKKVNIEWLMPILTMHTPDMNLFNVKMPNFVNYVNGVTTYATGLNAGSEVWNGANHYHVDHADSNMIRLSSDHPVTTTEDSIDYSHFRDSVLRAYGFFTPNN